MTELIKRRPANSIENRENQLIALAVDLAEQQIIKGTASSQVISHFLKLGSTKEKLEQTILEHEIELLKAKTDAMKSGKKVEELYTEALNAMRLYKGESSNDNTIIQ